MVETTYIQNWSQILVNDNDVGENSDVDVDVVDGDDDDDGDGDDAVVYTKDRTFILT